MKMQTKMTNKTLIFNFRFLLLHFYGSVRETGRYGRNRGGDTNKGPQGGI